MTAVILRRDADEGNGETGAVRLILMSDRAEVVVGGRLDTAPRPAAGLLSLRWEGPSSMTECGFSVSSLVSCSWHLAPPSAPVSELQQASQLNRRNGRDESISPSHPAVDGISCSYLRAHLTE